MQYGYQLVINNYLHVKRAWYSINIWLKYNLIVTNNEIKRLNNCSSIKNCFIKLDVKICFSGLVKFQNYHIYDL